MMAEAPVCPSALVMEEGTSAHILHEISLAPSTLALCPFASLIPASHLYSLGPISLETGT